MWKVQVMGPDGVSEVMGFPHFQAALQWIDESEELYREFWLAFDVDEADRVGTITSPVKLK